ncbi:DUF3293 domain-containing protein [Paraburkholderia susongensis]|uniref:DUF3293 domain-containing protein n=1 Tax=Paraburkholderia susongensis TaxID=1515439 RepID=A0A1X7I0U8_9BURK|nr:DUF3293 domain-containing protein [Paraburkholderia susongensis]SMG07390.1 Protein of unknown function [Paraburkholderia susongensis]
MTAHSNIDPATIKAYRETNYCVEGDMPITLQVDQKNDALSTLHKAMGVESSVFITAWNPYSRKCDDETNAGLQKKLIDELTTRGLRFVNGVGRHPASDWAEPSFLVLGISLEAAKRLGKQYEQNAIVWCGVDAVPQLVLLR